MASDAVRKSLERASLAASRGFDEPCLHNFVDRDNGDVLVLAVANPTFPDNYGTQLAVTEIGSDDPVVVVALSENETEFLRLALGRGKKWRDSMASR